MEILIDGVVEDIIGCRYCPYFCIRTKNEDTKYICNLDNHIINHKKLNLYKEIDNNCKYKK